MFVNTCALWGIFVFFTLLWYIYLTKLYCDNAIWGKFTSVLIMIMHCGVISFCLINCCAIWGIFSEFLVSYLNNMGYFFHARPTGKQYGVKYLLNLHKFQIYSAVWGNSFFILIFVVQYGVFFDL
jgi:hypothetical protein